MQSVSGALKNRAMILQHMSQKGGDVAGFVGSPAFGGAGFGDWIKSAYNRFKPYAYESLNNFIQGFSKGFQNKGDDLGMKALEGLKLGAKEAVPSLLKGVEKGLTGAGLRQFDRAGNVIAVQKSETKALQRPKLY